MFSITGRTLDMAVAYIAQHCNHPALYLFRCAKEPHVCLGSDRLAKRVLQMMETAGVDVTVFKAHSVRGATATHLMTMGVPQAWVQARGNWKSTVTLDAYYNRLHQGQDWEEQLAGSGLQGEDAVSRQSLSRAVLPPPAPGLEPTKEAERRETRGKALHGTRIWTPCSSWRALGCCGPSTPKKSVPRAA